VVIYAALRLIDVGEFRRIARFRWSERGILGVGEALVTEVRRRGIATARVKQDLRDVMTRAGLVELIGEERMYMTLPTAVSAYREWVAAQP
jgi:hypothetical protein